MTRILFVCLGNICRSPMAEFILKDLVAKEGLSDQFQIDSAATSAEELGNPVYPPARRKLREHGLNCEGKTARQISLSDYTRYDYLIGMDNANLQAMLRRFHGIRRENSTCFWIIQISPGMLQIHGIPAISLPPGTIFSQAAKDCFGQSRQITYKNYAPVQVSAQGRSFLIQ